MMKDRGFIVNILSKFDIIIQSPKERRASGALALCGTPLTASRNGRKLSWRMLPIAFDGVTALVGNGFIRSGTIENTDCFGLPERINPFPTDLHQQNYFK